MITKAVFLVILGMHPVDNVIHPQVMGPYASAEECKAGANEFGKLASEAGLVSENFSMICYVSKWDLKQPPQEDKKPAEDDGEKVQGWEGDL